MFLLESVGVEIAFQRFKIIVLELKAYILGPPHRKWMRPAIQKDNEVKHDGFGGESQLENPILDDEKVNI